MLYNSSYQHTAALHNILVHTIRNAPLAKVDFDTMKEHLKAGADPNELFYDGYGYNHEYPLFWRVFFLSPYNYNEPTDKETLQIRMLDLMSEYGLNVNTTDNKGYTCFNCVMRRDQYLPIKKLIELGADLTLKGPNGNTALHQLVYSWQRNNLSPDEMKDYLITILEAGGDINAVNYAELNAFGRLCLDYWEANQKSSGLGKLLKDMLKILIQYGADIYTPITTLEWQGDAAMEVKLSPIKTLPKDLQKELIEYKTYRDIIEKTEDRDLEIFER